MRFSIGLAAVGAAILAGIALVIGGSYWASRHRENGKTGEQTGDEGEQDLV